jgi:hypothetical protein
MLFCKEAHINSDKFCFEDNTLDNVAVSESVIWLSAEMQEYKIPTQASNSEFMHFDYYYYFQMNSCFLFWLKLMLTVTWFARF